MMYNVQTIAIQNTLTVVSIILIEQIIFPGYDTQSNRMYFVYIVWHFIIYGICFASQSSDRKNAMDKLRGTLYWHEQS